MSAGTLDGRVAVVTGGSRGLGKAIAKSIGSAGASVALVSRDMNALSAAAADVRGTGADVDIFQADVTDENEVRRVEHDVLSRFGHVDILVNNAGMNARKPMEEFSLEEWNSVLATNLTSAFLMCRSFVPPNEGAWIWPNYQSDVHHEPRLDSRAERVLREQGRAAGVHESTRAGACS